MSLDCAFLIIFMLGIICGFFLAGIDGLAKKDGYEHRQH